jgi:hypothetical protein
MKATIQIEIDHLVVDDLMSSNAVIKELFAAAYEHGRRDFKEGFNIQLTIRDCK